MGNPRHGHPVSEWSPTRRWAVRSLRRGRGVRSDAGVGLLDIAVTALVIGLVLIPISDLLAVSESSLATGRDDLVAASLAGQQLQQAAATPFSTFIQNDYGQTRSTQIVGGVTYTITQDVEWVGQGSTTNDCVTGAAASSQIVRVEASVTWASDGLGTPVSAATTISPAITAEPTSTGLALPVLTGPAGAGVSGATVTLTATGVSTRTVTTGPDGCAYFPSLSPGTYTATVSATGYVSEQELASPTVSSVVGSGNTVVLPPLYFAPAGLLEVTGDTPAGLVPATGLTYSVGNTALQPLGWYSAPAGTTELSLYPLSGGYSTWAGDCEDSDPQGVVTGTSTPLYPGSPTPSAAPVASGQLAPVTAQLYPLPVDVVTAAGAPVAGATVSAVPTGADCQTPIASYGLVPTGSGGLGTTGVPLGHLTVTATSGALRGTATVWVTPAGLETTAGTPIAGPLVVTVP